MSKKDLSNKPQNVRVRENKGAAWYYEEPRGLELIVEVVKTASGGEKYKDYIHVTIPWKSVRASVSRYEAE